MQSSAHCILLLRLATAAAFTALLRPLPPQQRGPTDLPIVAQLSGGLTFEDDQRGQILISAQKPLGMLLEETDDGGCVIAALDEAGSAARAGVQEGDLLLAVNNADISDATFDQVMSRLQNAPRVVNLRFSRRSSAPPTMSMSGRSSVDAGPRIEPLGAGGDRARSTKPVLLYLPDVDLGWEAIRGQLVALQRDFEVRALVAPPSDQTDVAALASLVSDAIESEAVASGRGTYLLGDRFGAVVALWAALRTGARGRAPRGLSGLVLVNPATSIELSWVAPSVIDAIDAVGRLVPSTVDRALSAARLPPPRTLAARLASARVAAADVADPKTLAALTLPVEILVGSDDRLLPSVDEGRLLARDLPNARLTLLKSSGRSPLAERSVDLARLLRASRLTERQPAARTDYIGEFRMPSAEAFANASASLRTIRQLSSPVFLSTTRDGQRVRGLLGLRDDLRRGRGAAQGDEEGGGRRPSPVLLVGNHNLIGPDISLLVDEVWRETGVLVRGLSHPSNFRVSAEAAAATAAAAGSAARASVAALPTSTRASARCRWAGAPSTR